MIEPDFIYIETRNEDDVLIKESWRNGELLHNTNGPAQIHYYPDGEEHAILYMLLERFHNENGPAIIIYRSDGSLNGEYFAINGILHREDGPAVCVYSKDGQLMLELFRINGKNPNNDDYFIPHMLESQFYEKQKESGRPQGVL